MTKFRPLLLSAIAGAMALTATAASAQDWAYHEWRADSDFSGAHWRAGQAYRDERRADAAAAWGDYGAADFYAQRAQTRRWQAHRDASQARREDRVARDEYWNHGWGY